ncbi:transposon Ty3-I Gag-Pol polyprotein [Trichonephila clavipes]|nr:transposon Ty3-I Gag-Pol polyprotein [Trichonephila clavipes]
MSNQTAETVTETFFSGWTSRYGVPESIITDRGRNFESDLFYTYSKLLGIEKRRTTSYHPASNGMIERWHRQLKNAIKCLATEKWVEALPAVLQWIRCSLKRI